MTRLVEHWRHRDFSRPHMRISAGTDNAFYPFWSIIATRLLLTRPIIAGQIATWGSNLGAKIMRALVLLLALICVGACQASSTVTRNDPKTETIQNSKTIPEPFEVVWDRLIRNLSSDFFVINNVEKASRIMNVSFSASDPREYVDCGTTRRTFDGGTAGEQTYNYENASPQYVFRAAYQNYPYEIVRKQTLEGRANIYVAPSSSGTDVVVNARYMLTAQGTITALHNIYLTPMQAEPITPETLSFDTGKPNTVPAINPGDVPVTCRAKGTLEQRILDAATRQ